MAMTVHCDIVSAEQEIFSGAIELLVAASVEGDVGINYGHAPLLTALKPGPVRVKKLDGEEEIFYVSGGYLEVQPHVVTVLADTALRAGDMDEAAAEAAMKEAEQAIQSSEGLDYSKAAAQLAESAAQLRTLQAIRKKLQR
ncbi:F0F1 ATP synthase subunit epsilon [Saccharophagus degradans]|uniref:ATP synthase epsilon chain n=2 Tax=Saccharophagus degradans TaxID=86304 RepID=ATPE_SACD2|nr:F0F1 ATP synthase subunit epsilon [Saccharophagus degradans]Q21DK9.1 RecName: Full=ATP synthase epsilon chain; AltName: Full=ATP synthase F1 sector epsilon subunit; AltName: Full=F-ATPase epsilon subunit [Saccharophagus degradans 2-40]ABD83220.1 ATP synthase F1, epsilon subunit [Saccharophagus degradans 2-40]MBU2986545.1 F0F1 ATP synthase subunit epsilon [Saccharophagus degradans]MDO6422632.1 F0F1 ATP synthase subunit epsilon [Saccharophagus degradans]MDO6609060.1 F0F1 ATP synthase subunit 